MTVQVRLTESAGPTDSAVAVPTTWDRNVTSVPPVTMDTQTVPSASVLGRVPMTPCVTQYQASVCVALGWWASSVIVVLGQASAFQSVQPLSASVTQQGQRSPQQIHKRVHVAACPMWMEPCVIHVNRSTGT